MNSLFSVETILVIQAVVPSFIIAFVGLALAKVDKGFSQKTVSNLIYYAFSPCLIFSSLYRRTFNYQEFGVLALAVVVLIFVMMGVACFTKRIENIAQRGYYLPVIFMSTGTVSLPISLFLYGNEGLSKAVIFHMVNIFFMYSFGVWLVKGEFEFRQILKIPALWAMFLGITVAEFPFTVGREAQDLLLLIAKGVDVIGLGAIPLLIISFGYSLGETKLSELRDGFVGGLTRIILGPILAFALIYAFRWVNLIPVEQTYDILDYMDLRTTEAIIILNAAMPGPIMAYLLNVKFDSCPKVAVAMLSVGTLGGIITIPIVLNLINYFIFKL